MATKQRKGKLVKQTGYEVGQRVEHKRYGMATIAAIRGGSLKLAYDSSGWPHFGEGWTSPELLKEEEDEESQLE